MTSSAVCAPLRRLMDPSALCVRNYWFQTLVAVIVLISLYDGFLVSKFQDCILHFEQNPVGRVLIQWNDGDVSLFLATKALGTSLVVLALVWLRRWNRRLSNPIISAIAFFQCVLLLYLLFATPPAYTGPSDDTLAQHSIRASLTR